VVKRRTRRFAAGRANRNPPTASSAVVRSRSTGAVLTRNRDRYYYRVHAKPSGTSSSYGIFCDLYHDRELNVWMLEKVLDVCHD
jgi:hypothetical protein